MIIIDSSVWISLFNPLDSNHDRAKKIFEGLNSEHIVIFDYIFTESMTVFRNKVSDEFCVKFEQLLHYWDISVFFTDHVLVRLATEYFFQFKKLSFTDCLSLASAKLNDYEIATFDEELKKASKLALAQ